MFCRALECSVQQFALGAATYPVCTLIHELGHFFTVEFLYDRSFSTIQLKVLVILEARFVLMMPIYQVLEDG